MWRKNTAVGPIGATSTVAAARGATGNGKLALCSHFLFEPPRFTSPPPLRGFVFELFIFYVAMALSKANALQNVFREAETPQELQDFLENTLDITSVGDFVEYVVRANYQEEWRNLVAGAFPVRPRVEAVEATEDAPATPAVNAFTDIDQRKLVAKMRNTYKVALGAEKEEEDTKKKAREDQVAEDMEKPLDPDLKRQVASLWTHDWQPISSMKAAPKFANRVIREFRALCVTNHTVEKAVTLLQAKRIVEPERLPVIPGLTGSSALIYEHDKPQTRQIHTLLEYFAALRLIMHTYAYAGGHRVESKIRPGTHVVFFPHRHCYRIPRYSSSQNPRDRDSGAYQTPMGTLP